jgi:Flp pilus assembly protein TadD
MGELLGADWILSGTFSVEENSLAARAQLLDVRAPRLSEPLEVAGNLADLVDLQTRVAWRLLATRDPAFTAGKEEDFRRLFPPVRLDAFENYIRGILAKDTDQRLRFLQEADRLDPSDTRAAFELGLAYFEQKDYENSARWLRKLKPKDPNYTEALFYLGVDEFFLGRDAVAEKAFDELSQQTPLNEVWNNLGVMQARRGRYAQALASLEQAYRGDPTDAVFCFNLGVCLWHLRRFREAANALQEAIALAHDDSDAHSLLASVFGALGETAARERELRWLAQQEGKANADVGMNAVPHLRLKKNYDGRAFRMLSLAVREAREQRLAGEPAAKHAEEHLRQGREFLTARRLREAEREAGEAVSLLPGDPEAHCLLGQIYEAQGRPQEAAAEFLASLKLKATAEGHLNLARVYLALDRLDAARDHSQAALSLEPQNSEARQLLTRIERTAASGKGP